MDVFPRESGPAPVVRQPVIVWDDATGSAAAGRGSAEWRSIVSLPCGRLGPVTLPFPEPTDPAPSRAEVFLRYLDYFRSCLVDRVESMADHDLRTSRLPSGWTPVELLKHVTYDERRWLEWGFQGRDVGDPWGDGRDRWYVAPDETVADLLAALRAQAARTREIVESNDLAAIGQPGVRWGGADPASLERIMFHLLQEYARHVGHLDIVAELAGGSTGE